MIHFCQIHKINYQGSAGLTSAGLTSAGVGIKCPMCAQYDALHSQQHVSGWNGASIESNRHNEIVDLLKDILYVLRQVGK